MLVNFCHPGLTKNVSSDVVCFEGYEPSNLISSNISQRKNGFLAERFMKPPVVVTFTLACEVNISHIVIFTKVGCQKSSGIEVRSLQLNFAKTNSLLCSAITEEFEDGFVFHRHGDEISNMLREQYKTLSFHSFRSSQLRTSVIKIKIFRTYNGTIPSIGRVEIWGHPSKYCSKNIIDNVYMTWNQIKYNPDSTFITNELSTSPVSKSETSSLQNNLSTLKNQVNSHRTICSNESKVDIPEEFIDPITCEIMVLPIILPSGKIIDSLTLEKYTEAESKWGRPASDPFTGKLITEKHRTVFANDLKSRIDKFLSDHSNLTPFMTLPRTVGRKYSPRNCYINVNGISNGKDASKSHDDFTLEVQQNKKTKTNHNEDLTQTMASHSHVGGSITEKNCISVDVFNHIKQVNHSCNSSENCSSLSKNYKPSVNLLYKKTLDKKYMSHEEESQLALDQALKVTLSTLPTYSNLKLKSGYSIECNQCCTKENLYKLPCMHLLCRKCLLTVTGSKCFKCTKCQSDFKTCDLKRFHS